MPIQWKPGINKKSLYHLTPDEENSITALSPRFALCAISTVNAGMYAAGIATSIIALSAILLPSAFIDFQNVKSVAPATSPEVQEACYRLVLALKVFATGAGFAALTLPGFIAVEEIQNRLQNAAMPATP